MIIITDDDDLNVFSTPYISGKEQAIINFQGGLRLKVPHIKDDLILCYRYSLQKSLTLGMSDL